MRAFLIFFWEIFKIIIVALVIIVPIRYFLVQPFFVKGESMEPSFEDGEYLLIDEISYYFREPQRGEVIIFRTPTNKAQFYIKRIIGLPGETVEIKNREVVIKNNANSSGFILSEKEYLIGAPSMNEQAFILKEGEYFVMGDNRAASYDSRHWGVLPRDNIIGKAWLRAWPVSRAQAIEAPVY